MNAVCYHPSPQDKFTRLKIFVLRLELLKNVSHFFFILLLYCFKFLVIVWLHVRNTYIYQAIKMAALEGYCFKMLKIIFVAISPYFIRSKFDYKHVLIE